MPYDLDQIAAKRHRLQQLELYDVSGDELDHLEQLGSSVGTDLQFCMFCLPIGISATLTLLVVNVTNPHVYETFWVAIFVGFGLGAFFGYRWLMARGQFSKCIDKIRQRQVRGVEK
jgi:hypothetical protein